MAKNFIVETNDLTKVYDRTPVVDHINLHIAEGEIFGLLGPNGAGKTTTILMLLGLTEPLSGSATVCGYNPTREPFQVKRLVGYMPEKVGFYENLTARENLSFIAELNNIPLTDSNKKIDELLKAVGINEVADTRVGKYSRGMKQRLGIADALIKNPRLAILDEPTAGLDPEGINQISRLIARLPAMGTTVVLSSHQLHQVERVCQSVGIIARGKMIVQDTISNLKKAGGTRQIEIETVNPGEGLIGKIRQIKGVINVETEGNTLLVTAASDLRPDVAKVVIDSEAPLIQMKIMGMTLDDIYMRYFKPEE